MKLLLVIATVFAVASAHVVPLNDGMQRGPINSTLEGIKFQMQCGFPSMGVPILAPISLNNHEINIDTEDLKLNVVLDKFRVWGLNDFVMSKFVTNPVTSKVVAEFKFPKIYSEGLYNLKSFVHKYGFTVNLHGVGNLDLSINDLSINVESKYSLGIVTGGGVKLKTLRVVASIGDVESQITGLLGHSIVNKKLNEVFEEMIMMAVNDNSIMIADKIESVAVPIINDTINGRSLSQIIAAIGGGGSGEPSEPCIPPTYD